MDKLNVLIVDDDATNRKFLRLLLMQEGHTALQAKDGVEALQILEREPIDAVISDILMPRMDGYRLCYEIHKSPVLNSLPFIAYTATYTSPHDETVALNFGADKFLAKPALPEVIIKALHEVVATRKSRTKALREPNELSAMKEYSEVLVRKLEETNSELADANKALNERAVLAEFNADVSNALGHKGNLREILQLCAAAMVRHLEAAFGRIWTLHARENVLELQASAGMYTHIDGPHGRVPVGQFKIGLIASERKPHLTNAVIDDDRVHDQAWAKREGMVAFAGYPLLVEERLVGVMALFAREPLSPNTLAAMESVANAIAAGIERKTTEKELRQSEERFRELAENIREIFYIVGPDGTPVHYVSPAFEEITGRSRTGFDGNPGFWLDVIHPEDRGRVEEAHKAAPERLASEYRIVRPDSSIRWIHARSFPVPDESGKPVRLVGIAEDITDRKSAQEAQEARQREIQTLYELSQKIVNTLDLQKILEEFLSQALAVGSFEVGVIRLLDRERQSLKVAATRGYIDSRNIEYLTIDLTQRHIGVNLKQALSRRKTIVAEDVIASEGWASFKREGVQSAIMLPIQTDQEVLGIIQLGSRKQQTMLSMDRPLIEALASQTAIAIQKARLYEQSQRHLERIRALHEINLAITSSLDLHALLETLLEKVDLFVPITAVSTVNLVNAGTGFPEPVVCRGMNAEEWRARASQTVSTWTQRVVESRAPVAVLDIQTIPKNSNSENYRALGLSSYLGVPLLADGKILGALGLYTREKHEFGDEEIEFFKTLASQAAIAIQNAQLYESTKRQQAQLVERESIQRILKELSQDITRMGAADLLEKLTATVREVFKVDIADTRMLAGAKWANIIVASDNLVQRLPDAGEFRIGATDWVVKNRKSITIVDYLAQKEFTPGRVTSMFGVRGFLAAPLISKSGEVIGVIRALSKEPRTFSPQEIDLFEQLALGAAIAIENEQLYANLQKSDKVKSEFLGIMSHELRTPLNIIMGYTALLKADLVRASDEPQRHALQAIESQTEAMLSMINRIMAATQLQSGAIIITKQPVDVGQLFEQLKTIYDLTQKKEVVLRWAAPRNLPFLITDREKLEKILQNLIENAIKFTERGTVTVSASLSNTSHEVRDKRYIEFTVQDSGIGIPAEILPGIFEMFKQGDSSATRSYEGVGLGLYIAKKYSELLGGNIAVESTEGRGAILRVQIPIDVAPSTLDPSVSLANSASEVTHST